MIQKIKSLVLTLATLAVAGMPLLIAAPAYAADINGGLCTGAGLQISETGNASDCSDASLGTARLNGLLTTIINIFSAVVGVIAVLMIIVGGLRYITSGGDSGKVSGAKTTIIYALVGLVVVALAQLIVHFVLAQAFNVAGGA